MSKKKNGISNFERKFSRYAIPNLSLILVMCYAAGYIIRIVNPDFLQYLTLDPYQILHGQVWRVFTWIIQPPGSLDVFTLLMLFFYYSIGTNLERVWGTYRYNVYIFGGMLITVIASFLCMGVCYLLFASRLADPRQAAYFFQMCSWGFSTYYINMSIFLAYSITYPEHQVLLMFVIPVKVKWLGIVYGVMLVINMLQYFMVGMLGWDYAYAWFAMVAIAASLINFLIFWIGTKRLSHLAPRQIKRRAEFRHQVREGAKQAGHKCSICGRTDGDDPTLEFRYCSKCAGSHEYCQYHLYSHEHVR
ncbi:MAG: hypothetical protein K2O32_13300 [Acetatifactor sp.]|nr:hypothetical protein [Acetatifactor sp.]